MLSPNTPSSRYTKQGSSPLHLPDIGGGASVPGPFLLGQKVVMVAKPSVSPSTSSPNKKSSPGSGNKNYVQTKSSPDDERLKQCISPMKRFPTDDTINSSSKRVSENSQPRHIVTSQRSQSSGGGTTATTARGNTISNLTRTSVNSLKKSKIPAPLRRSLDLGSSDRNSTEKTSLLSASRGDDHRVSLSSTAPARLNLDSIMNNDSNNSTKTTDILGRPRRDSDLSDSGTDRSSHSGSSNSVMVKTLTSSSAITSNSSAISFQNACKARVAQQKKALAAAIRSSKDSSGGARDVHAALKEAAQVAENDKKRRNRSEIYAINAYLRKVEKHRYQTFLSEHEKTIGNDDVSWCSADSSVMPTPRYRNQDGKRPGQDGSATPSKSPSKALGGV
jgi:hypothetical protein